jgi:hypothetical protein
MTLSATKYYCSLLIPKYLVFKPKCQLSTAEITEMPVFCGLNAKIYRSLNTKTEFPIAKIVIGRFHFQNLGLAKSGMQISREQKSGCAGSRTGTGIRLDPDQTPT